MPVDTLAEGEQEAAAKPRKEMRDSDSKDQVCYCFSACHDAHVHCMSGV